MTCTRPQAPVAPLSVTRGASKTWLFTVRFASSSQPRDITGAKVWFTIKNRIEDAGALVSKRNTVAGGVDNQILIVAPQVGVAVGQFKVFIDPSDTYPLDPSASYWCDAWVQLPGGPPIDRQQVMKNRPLVIEPAVTNVFT